MVVVIFYRLVCYRLVRCFFLAFCLSFWSKLGVFFIVLFTVAICSLFEWLLWTTPCWVLQFFCTACFALLSMVSFVKFDAFKWQYLLLCHKIVYSFSACFVCGQYFACVSNVNCAAIVTFQKCADYIYVNIWCRLDCIMKQQWCCALSQVSHICYQHYMIQLLAKNCCLVGA